MAQQTTIFGVVAIDDARRNGAAGKPFQPQAPLRGAVRHGKPCEADQTNPAAVPDRAMFLELRKRPQRGERHVRVEHCARCSTNTPHEYVCLQPAGPRVWGYACTSCRRARQEREGESCE